MVLNGAYNTGKYHSGGEEGQCEHLTPDMGEGWDAPAQQGDCRSRTAHHLGTRVVPPGGLRKRHWPLITLLAPELAVSYTHLTLPTKA